MQKGPQSLLREGKEVLKLPGFHFFTLQGAQKTPQSGFLIFQQPTGQLGLGRGLRRGTAGREGQAEGEQGRCRAGQGSHADSS
jgi:hypothetical protein